MKKRTNRSEATAKRCAIYTRKSTNEGLDQAVNTLGAQRESGEIPFLAEVIITAAL